MRTQHAHTTELSLGCLTHMKSHKCLKLPSSPKLLSLQRLRGMKR